MDIVADEDKKHIWSEYGDRVASLEIQMYVLAYRQKEIIPII